MIGAVNQQHLLLKPVALGQLTQKFDLPNVDPQIKR